MPEVQEGPQDHSGHAVDPDALAELVWGHVDDLQASVNNHMEAVWDVHERQEETGDYSIESPAYAAFCGCDTCVQRETLMAFSEALISIARSTIAESAA